MRRNDEGERHSKEMCTVPTWHQSQRDLGNIPFIWTLEGNFHQLIQKLPLTIPPAGGSSDTSLFPGTFMKLRSVLPWRALLGTREPPHNAHSTSPMLITCPPPPPWRVPWPVSHEDQHAVPIACH